MNGLQFAATVRDGSGTESSSSRVISCLWAWFGAQEPALCEVLKLQPRRTKEDRKSCRILHDV